MEIGAAVSVVVALISATIAFLTWLTSASKDQVASLCKIVEAQAEYVERLERQLSAARETADRQDVRIEALETDLETARAQLATLERENVWLRRVMRAAGVDPDDLGS